MTDREFQIAIAPLNAHLGKNLSPEQLRYWHEMLDDLDAETVKRAIITTLRDYQFGGIPPVGLVRKNAGAVAGTLAPIDRAGIAWAAVKSAVAQHGGYATVEFDDPLVTAAIRMLGGWVTVCDTAPGEPFDTWLRKRFVELYGTMASAGVAAEMTEPLPGIGSPTGRFGDEPRLVETGLPPVSKSLVRGERRPAALPSSPDVRRLAETLPAADPFVAPTATEREFEKQFTTPTKEEQLALLAKRFGDVRRLEHKQDRDVLVERLEIEAKIQRAEAT